MVAPVVLVPPAGPGRQERRELTLLKAEKADAMLPDKVELGGLEATVVPEGPAVMVLRQVKLITQ
jgi:hypothetical protein